MAKINPLTHSLLAELPHVRHGFFDCHGGVSSGLYESLNGGMGSGDDKSSVEENRQRVKNFFSAEKLLSIHQYHSAVSVVVDSNTKTEEKADGMVTNQRGLLLVILTADCAPIIFADSKKNIIGACHAGWRGASKGVIENTIEKMCQLGADKKNIIAILGPMIGPDSYEVGDDMKMEAMASHPILKENADNFFMPKGKKFIFNLPKFCQKVLKDNNIEKNIWVEKDTFADNNFFSHRRNSLAGHKDYGRLMNVIMLV